jgi:hypothetical protein|nr:hypothetical protein [Kofleriaceae bacterium]
MTLAAARALAAAVAAIAATAVACGDNVTPTPLRTTVASFPDVQNPDLDLLFLIDNTTSAYNERALTESPLADALAALPGGLPNLHIGFATSDLGTLGTDSPTPGPSVGTSEEPGHCVGSGDDGRLVTPQLQLPEPYLVIGDGSQNFDGTLRDTLGEIVEGIGVAGCGFEQHLAAVARAFANPANAGFHRPGANLAIVVLGDEDDCSVSDPSFFDADPTTLGPLGSFRCTRWGITCDQDVDSVGDKTNCRPAIDSPYLSDLAPLVAAVRAAEPDPYHLTAFAIVGDPTPVRVETRDIDRSDQLALAHSCELTDSSGSLEVADPAVRTAAWARELNGAWSTICRSDDTQPVSQLSAQLTQLVAGNACITAPVDPATCTAADVDDLTGARTPLALALAPSGRCPLLATVDRAGGAAASPDHHVEVACDIDSMTEPDAGAH